MRIRILLALLAVTLAPAASPAMAAEDPTGAVRNLIDRLLPGRSAQFLLRSIPPEGGRAVFELDNADGRICIRGSSGVAMASGLNWYLTHVGGCQVSFCGDRLALADPPPPVPAPVRRVSPYRYRYCFNYCAFSYTMAFWDWPQWERMIDWMALHGINMPLAVTGQESVWKRVYGRLGLRQQEMDAFFVGPAYLPFGWMGCLDGWCGPLPANWVTERAGLQRKILFRQRELGMTPVLQGFTGHVPAALQRVFPDARFQRLPSWCQFPGTLFIDPMDPLFERIGKAFIEEQTTRFGTDHLYASDTFIEMAPPSSDPAFLDRMGRAVYGAMAAADPEAVWVMQGWVFINNPEFWKPPQGRALLGGVPDDRMILLDLMCESNPAWRKTEAFYGKPWAFCIIQSFGWQVSLHGGLPQIRQNLLEATTSPARGKLAGLGLIMEGFGYNPAVFEYLTEMAWHDEPPPLAPWIRGFLTSRYGQLPPAADEAWLRLQETVYTRPGQAGSILCSRPSLNLHRATEYDPAVLAQAWAKLLECRAELGAETTYRYDVAHVARQVLDDLAIDFYEDLRKAWQEQDAQRVRQAGDDLLELIDDLDTLLATRPEFLLGTWLADAKHWATTDEERLSYEQNARRLITLWGPRESGLHEYAQREWAGMLRGFYRPRWEMMLTRMRRALAEKTPLDAARLEEDLRDFDESWVHGSESYPETPSGDTLEVAQSLWEKYHPRMERPKESTRLTTGEPASGSSLP